MKLLLLIPLFLCCSGIVPQKAVEPKINSAEYLDEHEANLLNSLLDKSQKGFDFHGKKVAFISGSSGSSILTKPIYFKTCIDPWVAKGDTPQIFMVLLTPEEKSRSGGCDVLVLSWVKVFTNRQKNRIIAILGKNE